MVKPAAPRELGRDDPRARSVGARRGARGGIPARHPRPRRDATWPVRATSRSLSSAAAPSSSCTARARSCRGHEFYDYAAKYTAGLSETSTRAEVTDAQRATLKKIARDAFRVIGGDGFSRVDFLLVGERIVLSEINTIPGFTPISLFPTMPAEGGYSFTDVCVRIVDLALERHAARAGRRLTPEDLPR